MGREQDSAYYDNNLQIVSTPLEQSPWLPLYKAAEEMIRPFGNEARIADLGCGTGRFARHIANLGYRDYIGIDFSEARVKLAQKYVPEFTFISGDLTKRETWQMLGQAGIFVALEFLEHIDKDLEILGNIPTGSFILFSVPNYDSAGHVRYFGSMAEVKARFASVVEWQRSTELVNQKRSLKRFFLALGRHQKRADKRIFLVLGRRR